MLNVLDWFRKHSPLGRDATKLYGSIVAQSRSPAFYADLGVSDTPNGRYEMIIVHMFLVLEHLRASEGVHGRQGRALVEQFVTDMDDSMREMAVGDMSIPRRVKKAAAGLLDRTADYRAGISSKDIGRLTQAIASYVYDDAIPADSAECQALAGYLHEAISTVHIADRCTAKGFPKPPSLLGSA